MKKMSTTNVFANGHHHHHHQHQHHMNIPPSIQSTNSIVNNNNDEKTFETWWNIRTNLEKFLLLSSLILLLLLIATLGSFLITIIVNNGSSSSNNYYLNRNLKTSKSLISTSTEPYVCLTPGCVKSASHIIESMDSLVDPCDDFYQFACGGWKESKYINEDQTGVTEFGALRENLNRKLRGK